MKAPGPDTDHWFESLYGELRRLARRQRLGASRGPGDGTTSIVHEAWLRLQHSRPDEVPHQGAFYSLAAHAMRSILVDNARRSQSQRRGGDWTPVTFDHARLVSSERSDELLALDRCLDRLSELDERLAEIVIYRFYGGLTVEETAAALACSPATVKRGWQLGRNWLYRALREQT